MVCMLRVVQDRPHCAPALCHGKLNAGEVPGESGAIDLTTIVILLLGIGAGILLGLLGIGGGIVLVPAMVHVLHMDQHLAQGTSLFILLPPIGLGALRQYWKAGHVDLRAGILLAFGMIFGAYAGGRIAVPMSTPALKAWFGAYLMFSSILLWLKAKPAEKARVAVTARQKESGA
jgi:uncharacterized membrane protein YfcA